MERAHGQDQSTHSHCMKNANTAPWRAMNPHLPQPAMESILDIGPHRRYPEDGKRTLHRGGWWCGTEYARRGRSKAGPRTTSGGASAFHGRRSTRSRTAAIDRKSVV